MSTRSPTFSLFTKHSTCSSHRTTNEHSVAATRPTRYAFRLPQPPHSQRALGSCHSFDCRSHHNSQWARGLHCIPPLIRFGSVASAQQQPACAPFPATYINVAPLGSLMAQSALSPFYSFLITYNKTGTLPPTHFTASL